MTREEQKIKRAEKNLKKAITFFIKKHEKNKDQSKLLEDVGLSIANLCMVLSKTLAEKCYSELDLDQHTARDILEEFTSAIKEDVVQAVDEVLYRQ